MTPVVVVVVVVVAPRRPRRGGKPALPSKRAELELLDDRRLSNGVVYLRHRIPT